MKATRDHVALSNRTLILFALISLAVLLSHPRGAADTVIAQSVCVPPPPDMISWWPGDGNANDIQGSNSGTLVNGATFAAGKVGQAFSFDGVDDFVNIPDAPSLDLLTAGTISVWAYYNDANNGQALIAKGNGATNAASYTWGTYADVLRFDLYQGDGTNYATVTMPTSALVGEWNLLTATWDGSTLRYYRNGVLQSSVPYSFVRLDTPYAVMIGSDPAGNRPINGRLDEIELYNRTLSASEIQALYNAGSAGKCKPQCTAPPTGMLSWWSGDGNANDIQGSNNGTLVNGVTFAAGKVGQAFSFNGTDAHVRVPDNADLYPGVGSFTVDAWIKTTQMSGVIVAHYECGNNCPSFAASLYYVFITADGKVRGFLRDSAGASQAITSAKVVADGVYHHIALVRDTTGLQMQLYVDGVVDASAPLIVTGTIKDDDSEPDPFTIGAIIQAGANHPSQLFLGEVDEVEYFNRALTASEIHAIVNAGSAGKCRTCTPPPSEMASWWPGDGNANDIQGSNNGTLVNGATFAAGKVGQAFKFDGVDDFVGVANTANMDFGTGDFTIDLWLNLNSLSTDQTLIQKVVGTFPNHQTYLLEFDTPNALRFLVRDTTANQNDLNVPVPSLTTGQWYHVAGARTGNTSRLYLNGILIGTQTAGDNMNTGIGGIPTIGKMAEGTGFRFVNGYLDEIELFNRALSQSEIQAIVNAGSAGKCKTPANRPPVAMCQNVTVSAGANCTASASIDNGSSDPDGDTITLSQSPAGPYPLGMTTVTLTVIDDDGASSSCTATVTVVDDAPPVITCPANRSEVGNVPGSCSATLSPGTATATDNCPGVSIAGVRSDNQPLNSSYPLGVTTINWTATDAAGNSASCQQLITVTNPAPVVTITGPPTGSVYAVNTPVSFTGSFADNPGGTHTATWMFDSLTSTGTVNETTGEVTGSFSFTAAGVYKVALTVADGCGGTGSASTINELDLLVVIYDPGAGFVTGGGWINSPAGAYSDNPGLTGKANFGFVSKYHNGATVPTGNTEFQFKAAGLNFHSTSYEWLVIAGARAQYKGFGTINGSGSYRFMLTAIDGQQPGGGGLDKFRIRIWSGGGGPVYDNQMNAPDSADPTTVLGGGSIVIHK